MFISGMKGWLVGVLIIVVCGGGAMVIGAIIGDKIEKWIKEREIDND